MSLFDKEPAPTAGMFLGQPGLPQRRPYPKEIDAEERAATAHIPTEQICQDIVDTIDEIRRINAVQHAEDIIATEHLSDLERRMARFRSDARPAQIDERKKFVAYLKLLLADRGGDVSQIPDT